MYVDREQLINKRIENETLIFKTNQLKWCPTVILCNRLMKIRTTGCDREIKNEDLTKIVYEFVFSLNESQSYIDFTHAYFQGSGRYLSSIFSFFTWRLLIGAQYRKYSVTLFVLSSLVCFRFSLFLLFVWKVFYLCLLVNG